MATVLKNYCINALKILSAQFDAAGALKHGSSVGSIREQAIRDFLEGHLPTLVRVVSGQIFDTNDARSNQQDVILVLRNVPRLPFASGIDLVYSEGVVATIEVKSNLSAPMTKDIGHNIASVRSLKVNIWGETSFPKSHNWPGLKILTVILAYESSSLQSIDAVLCTMDDISRPDIVLSLSKGLLVRNHGLLFPQQPSKVYLTFDDPALGFMYFLTFLTEITATLGSRGVDWRAYL